MYLITGLAIGFVQLRGARLVLCAVVAFVATILAMQSPRFYGSGMQIFVSVFPFYFLHQLVLSEIVVFIRWGVRSLMKRQQIPANTESQNREFSTRDTQLTNTYAKSMTWSSTKEFLFGLTAVPAVIAFMIGGPITYIICILDTWGGRSSILVKIVINLTLDAFLATIWPITWILWLFSFFNSHSGPIRTVLGF